MLPGSSAHLLSRSFMQDQVMVLAYFIQAYYRRPYGNELLSPVQINHVHTD